MLTYTAFVKALHNAGLTQQIAIYMRLTHGVSYLDFYEAVIDGWIKEAQSTRNWYEAVAKHFSRFLNDENATEHMVVEGLPRVEYLLDPSRWLYVNICLHIDSFYDQFAGFVAKRFATNVASLCEYQKNLVILPTYDRKAGARFRTAFDWVAYFERARGRVGGDPFGEPEPVKDMVVAVSDQTSRGYFEQQLDWGQGDAEERWGKWVDQIVLDRNSVNLRKFQRLRMVSARDVVSV